MRSSLSVLFVGALLFAGCGGDEPKAEAAKDTATAAPKETATPTATPASDQVQVRAVVKRYFAAVADGDGAGACETLLKSEQTHFEKKFGSCAKAFEDVEGKSKGLRAGTVTIDGDGAKIEAVEEDTGNAVKGPVYAVREDGKWWMARKVAYRRAID
jgi:hypothetical protein